MADEKKDAPKPTTAEGADEAPKHPMVALFGRIGLRRDAQFRTIRFIDGHYLNNVQVVDIVACIEPFEAVVILKEAGTSITQSYRYAAISGFVPQ